MRRRVGTVWAWGGPGRGELALAWDRRLLRGPEARPRASGTGTKGLPGAGRKTKQGGRCGESETGERETGRASGKWGLRKARRAS